MTKEETRRYHYNRYNQSNYYSLNQLYNSYSWNKQNAFNKCIERMKENDGYNYHLIKMTCHFFGFAYLYDEVNPETGEVTVHLVYKTGMNTYNHDVTDLV